MMIIADMIIGIKVKGIISNVGYRKGYELNSEKGLKLTFTYFDIAIPVTKKSS